MKSFNTLVFLAFSACVALGAGALAPAAAAEDAPEGMEILPAEGLDLNDFLWVKRPLVIFADTPADPAFDEQMRLLERGSADLAERDVVVITDTDPKAATAVRTALRPRGFALVLVDKDGKVALRKPTPWDIRELSRAIDKMPLRIEEIRSQRLN